MRGPLIAGVDISTRAIHAALIPLDPTIGAFAELRCARVAVADKGPQRLRNVRKAMHHVLADATDGEIVAVFIEQPPFFGKLRGGTELIEVYGAACASTPLRIDVVGSMQPQTWRSKVGLALEPHEKNGRAALDGAWKRAAIRRVLDSCLVEADYPLNEHEADSVLVALAGRGLWWKNHANEQREICA